MRFGSVCSGIEAASVAWHPLGWQAAWLSEIEPFPSAVLAHHYPDVPNLGDMTTLPGRILSGEVEAPDLFCGGTPCQAFSVAGSRRSLDDARGNLSLTFCEIANAIDNVRTARGKQPCIVFWENVPGVLSTADNAFGCFLGALSGTDTAIIPGKLGWTDAGVVNGPQRSVAWRILDAQYFGVAQRRRRVFVVASARAGFDSSEILFEWNGMRRDTAPSRQARQVAPTLTKEGTGVSRTGHNEDGWYVTTTFDRQSSGEYGTASVASTIAARDYKGPSDLVGHGIDAIPIDTMNHIGRKDDHSLGDFEPGAPSYTLTKGHSHAVAQPISYGIPGNWIGRKPENGGNAAEPMHDIAPCLTKTDIHGVAQPMPFKETADCLTSAYGTKWNGNASATNGSLFVAQPMVVHGTQDPCTSDVAFTQGRNNGGENVLVAPTLTASNDPSRSPQSSEVTNQVASVYASAMAVRRLTPVECERLQGFPDNYTDIKPKGKDTPDGPRYKALGNSWAVPVVRWIGRRIVESLEKESLV